MSVKLKIAEPDGIYFITITCYKWLPLFDIADSYDGIHGIFPADNIMDIMEIDLSKRI